MAGRSKCCDSSSRPTRRGNLAPQGGGPHSFVASGRKTVQKPNVDRWSMTFDNVLQAVSNIAVED